MDDQTDLIEYDAFDDGWDAFDAGKKTKDCPIKDGDAYHRWIDGWNSAHNALKDRIKYTGSEF